jgi:hypothetical protein
MLLMCFVWKNIEFVYYLQYIYFSPLAISELLWNLVRSTRFLFIVLEKCVKNIILIFLEKILILCTAQQFLIRFLSTNLAGRNEE